MVRAWGGLGGPCGGPGARGLWWGLRGGWGGGEMAKGRSDERALQNADIFKARDEDIGKAMRW